jgi:hypothetical protein
MHKYFIIFFQLISFIYVLVNTISSFFVSITCTRITTIISMLMRIVIPKDSNVFTLDGSLYKTTYGLYPLIFYAGLIFTNFYYSTLIMLIIDNILVAFISATSVYIYYLTINAEKKYYYDFTEQYVLLYENIILKKIIICQCCLALIISTVIADVILNFNADYLIYLIARCSFKSLMLIHCYRHLLVQKINQQKKIC